MLQQDGQRANNSCIMTQVATFINTNGVQLPFFGVVIFYANLVFLALYFIFQVRQSVVTLAAAHP